MSNENKNLLDEWDSLKVLVSSLEIDLNKNAKGNKSAGVRTRKGLRELKKIAGSLVKTSLSTDRR